MASVIGVSTNKGGSLKTTITINIGGNLANKKKKVCLIDLDNQGNVAVSFGINPDELEFTIYDVLTNSETKIENAIINVAPNLDIIAANDDMAYLEMDVLTDSKKFPDPLNLLKKPIEKLKDLYDYIIIDTPPAMGMIAANVFNSVDDIILPYHPEMYSFRSMVKSIKSINNFKESNPNLNLKAVVPVKVKQTITHRAFVQSALALCQQNKIKFTQTQVPESIKYPEVIGRYEKPITLLEEKDLSKELKNYKKIYNELVEELGYNG